VITKGRRERGTEQRGSQLTRWEIVGAWLHVWTPPRDAEVPPVPKRKVAIGTAVLLAVLGGAIALMAPRIEHGKERRAQAESRRVAALKAVERRRLVNEQRLHTARSSELHRRGKLAPAAERRLRRRVLDDVERSITRDARDRVRRGLFDGPIRRTACQPYPASLKGVGPETTLSGAIGKYSCTAVQAYIPNGSAGRGALGYPFWAKVDFRRLTYAWCKINPRPGERTVGREFVLVPPPKGCDLGY
jgi:hypothetical protein